MGKRRFYVEFIVEVELELDDTVIRSMRGQYKPIEAAEYIGKHLITGHGLNQLQGFSDQPEENYARLIRGPKWEVIDSTERKEDEP